MNSIKSPIVVTALLIRDPRTGRSILHRYAVRTLPVIA